MKNEIILTILILSMITLLFSGCGGGGTTPPITPETYTITASAGPHGSISPSGDVTVNQGSNKSFTVTPDTGYRIKDVLVDGSSVGARSSYTFTNVTENHTISATFISVAPGLVHNLTKGIYYNIIQAALDDADSGDTIEVADGTYDESITFPSGKKIILQSVNGASSTTIKGNSGSDTVILNGSLIGTTLKGFTITHNSGDKGRGIYINNLGYLNINNCSVSGNSSYYEGGGIANWEGSLTITESSISGNSGFDGGGIENWEGSTLTIIASNISNNFATGNSGGGIDNIGSLTITESTISGNTSNGLSGGIDNGGSLTITESTISDNLAGSGGGGIYNSDTLTIIKSTISNNSASSGSVWGSGGGIKHFVNGLWNSGSLTITGSTISDNSAGYGGGGIYIEVFLPLCTPLIITIGGSSDTDKNTICGNYKIGYNPTLDQQIWDYETYKDTNYISVYCD